MPVRRWLAVLAASVVLLAGCGGSDDAPAQADVTGGGEAAGGGVAGGDGGGAAAEPADAAPATPFGPVAVTGSDGAVQGWVRAEPSAGGTGVTADYVFVITDATIQNNGECIDVEGTWCADDPDGLHNDVAEIRYLYALVFRNTENDEVVAHAYVTPIYCNKDAVLADMAQFHDKALEDRTDYACNGWTVATWQPTDSFVAIGSSYFESLDRLTGATELGLYDIHSLWETHSDGPGSVTQGFYADSNTYPEQPLVKTYPVTVGG